MRPQTRERIYNIMEEIVRLAKNDGDEVLIGVSTLEDNIIYEEVITNEGLSYENACKLYTGIGHSIGERYGYAEEDEP